MDVPLPNLEQISEDGGEVAPSVLAKWEMPNKR